MQLSFRRIDIGRLVLAGGVALLTTACAVDKSEAPDLNAPSAFGLSIAGSASPDVLPRDGHSTSQLRFTVQDYLGNAMQGQRLNVSTNAGSLSTGVLTTDANGSATVQLTAPGVNSPATEASVLVTPFQNGEASSSTRVFTVLLSGPGAPVASFNWSPSLPGRGDLVTFDATSTTLNGLSCLDDCTYSWDFKDGTGSGRISSHRFSSAGTYSVVLTVTSPAGTIATSTRSVVIGQPAAITAVITQSPTDARVSPGVVYFDGSSSTTPDGARISSYTWDFGDGSPQETGVKLSHEYALPRTYTVRLTIVDETNRTATTTKSVTVAP
jgi:large repetitive protein